MMDYVMCELCHTFHVGTMYYVSLCATNYVTYELWLWFFPMAACFYVYDFFLFYVMHALWLWLFSFLCHVFHLETKNGVCCFYLLYGIFHFMSMFFISF
jgi:hypothetical protein